MQKISLECKKTQNSISLSIDNTISLDPETVANTFNDFFTSVADDVRSTVPPSNHHFSNFLKNSNRNLIIMVLEAPAKTGSSRTYLTDTNLCQSKIRSLVYQAWCSSRLCAGSPVVLAIHQ